MKELRSRGASETDVSRGDGAAAPGKRSLADTHATAEAGIAGAGIPLPYLAQIQGAFGQHDVGGISAHVGGAAADASEALGARAYATGERVAFRDAPDLHTAAHEAAHVVQQRGGVQLAGGKGAAGDPYEQHADAVADRVVAGGFVEELLGNAPRGGSARAVQCAGEDETTTPERRGAQERRQVVTFITGRGGVFDLALGYWRGRTDRLVTSCTSLEEILEWLRVPANRPQHGPWAEINFVTHANEFGDMGMPVRDGGVDSSGNAGTDVPGLQAAVDGGIVRALPDDVVDRATNVNVHGCAIGRSPEALHQLSRAFGGDDAEAPTVYAPRHLQTYSQQGSQFDESLTEYWFVDYLEGARPRDAALVGMFTHKYPDAGVDWHRWLSRGQVHTAHERFRMPPQSGTMYWHVPPRGMDRAEHERFLRGYQFRRAWTSFDIVSNTVTEDRDTPNLWQRRTHTLEYSVRYSPGGPPNTERIVIDEPVAPRDDADWERLLRHSYGGRYDQYRWTNFRAVFEGGNRVGQMRSLVVEADGHRTLLRIERALMEHGHLAHPSRTDERHYGHFAPPPPPAPPLPPNGGNQPGTANTNPPAP